MTVEWVEPPARPASRLAVVVAQLKSRPGQWACIERNNVPFLPWWGPLNTREHEDFEVEMRRVNPEKHKGLLFAPVDVYARYVGKEAGE